MNKVILLGNVGGEVRVSTLGSGDMALNFSLATNERVKKGEEWVEHTEWHRIGVLGRRAEALSRLLHKGSKIMVEGVLRTREYEKDGIKRYSTEIRAHEIFLCDPKPQGQEQQRKATFRIPEKRNADDPFSGYGEDDGGYLR